MKVELTYPMSMVYEEEPVACPECGKKFHVIIVDSETGQTWCPDCWFSKYFKRTQLRVVARMLAAHCEHIDRDLEQKEFSKEELKKKFELVSKNYNMLRELLIELGVIDDESKRDFCKCSRRGKICRGSNDIH